MKTRQELILDFMLALASGVYATEARWIKPDEMYSDAVAYVDKYLENI